MMCVVYMYVIVLVAATFDIDYEVFIYTFYEVCAITTVITADQIAVLLLLIL